MYSDWAEKSKADKQLVYRALLSLYKIGQSLKGKDFDAVLELLQQHPDAKNKIGVGIKDLLVDKDGYGGKCFHLVRQDGTKESFSYLKCLGYKNIRREINKPQETTQPEIIKTYQQPIKKETSAMVSESKQTSQPKQPQQNKQPQPPAPTPKKKSFFERIQDECEDGNNRMVFQLKSGVFVEGIVAEEESGFIKIVDAVITAKNSISKVKWVRMERTQIGHFYALPTEIKIIE
jgi:hypothetical protein